MNEKGISLKILKDVTFKSFFFPDVLVLRKQKKTTFSFKNLQQYNSYVMIINFGIVFRN